jgi:methionyl-tRNA formyltransferase
MTTSRIHRDIKVLFICKADNQYATAAAEFVRHHFANAQIVFSSRTEPFPEYLREWRGDLLISYLAQWILPSELIGNAKIAAINLHPGPPSYPGIGCTNFAIYNGEKEFGVTCHHMLAKVDSGSIIAVRRFPILEKDTVWTLTQRCYVEILHLFLGLMTEVIKGKSFPVSDEDWTRKAYKRKELDELCQLRPDMSDDEIQRRIRATTYGDIVWAYQTEEKVQV